MKQKKMTYHIGIYKGSGNCYPLHRNGSRSDTLIMEVVRNVDYLNPQTWKYFGVYDTTKKELRDRRSEILRQINQAENTNFKRLIIK